MAIDKVAEDQGGMMGGHSGVGIHNIILEC